MMILLLWVLLPVQLVNWAIALKGGLLPSSPPATSCLHFFFKTFTSFKSFSRKFFSIASLNNKRDFHEDLLSIAHLKSNVVLLFDCGLLSTIQPAGLSEAHKGSSKDPSGACSLRSLNMIQHSLCFCNTVYPFKIFCAKPGTAAARVLN